MGKKILKAVLVCCDEGRWYCTAPLDADHARGVQAHMVIFQTSNLHDFPLDEIVPFIWCLDHSPLRGVFDLLGAVTADKLEKIESYLSHRG